MHWTVLKSPTLFVLLDSSGGQWRSSVGHMYSSIPLKWKLKSLLLFVPPTSSMSLAIVFQNWLHCLHSYSQHHQKLQCVHDHGIPIPTKGMDLKEVKEGLSMTAIEETFPRDLKPKRVLLCRTPCKCLPFIHSSQ